MKKVFILLSLLITSFCTIIPPVSGIVDPTILDPVSGLLFEKAGGLSYIFFSKEQHVLIHNANGGINSYYKLLEGEAYRDNVITYKLEGWGSYNDNYLGIFMRGTELGITIQNSRILAINATKNLESATGNKDVTSGTKLDSPALYTLHVLSPIIKTSAAGIFRPEDNEYLSITALNPSQFVHAKLLKSIKNGDSFSSTEHDLRFVESLSDISAIYEYSGTVLGIKFDFYNEFPRLQILEKPFTGDNRGEVIANLKRDLENVFTWEYAFFSSLRVLDSSLAPYLDKTFIEFISQVQDSYNPLKTSRWFFNKEEDSIRITRTYGDIFTEEDYLIGPTSTSGVFELLDFRNDSSQTYSDKFLTITSEGNISTVTIANTEDDFNNPIFQTRLKPIEDVSPFTITLANLRKIENSVLGHVLEPDGTPTTAPINGRSGFQAYVESDTGIIHLVGGYTNAGSFFSNIPKTGSGTVSLLQAVYNNIYTIKNIRNATTATLNSSANGLVLSSTAAHQLGFQQMVGATTKQSQTHTKDVFWSYGTGAIRDDRFSFNNIGTTWNTSDVRTPFRQRYHSSIVAHNNHLYIMGGTIDSTLAPLHGTFDNTIYISDVRSSRPSSWRSIQTSGTIWTPRIHSRVFSIGKTLVLVGGMTQTSANDVAIPTNDVWTSTNNGTNWNPVNNGLTPDPNAPAGSVAPPKPHQNGGPLVGTAHNGIIYLLDPQTRDIYYSSNKGVDWFKATTGFATNPQEPLYGAQLVAYKDELILIGGQTETGTATTDFMEKNIYKLRITQMY